MSGLLLVLVLVAFAAVGMFLDCELEALEAFFLDLAVALLAWNSSQSCFFLSGEHFLQSPSLWGPPQWKHLMGCLNFAEV